MKDFYTNIINVGDDMIVVGYKDGKKIKEKVPFPTEIFTEVNEYTGHVSQDGRNLLKHVKTIKEFFEFTKTYRQEIPLYGDIAPVYQFIQTKWGKEEQFYDISLVRTAVIDIEVLSEEGFPNINHPVSPISAITVKNLKNGNFYVISLKDFDKEKMQINIDKSKIYFKKFDNEVELLQGFLYIIKTISPDIITGWNVEYFDIPYLTNRIAFLLGEDFLKQLSPINKVTKTKTKMSFQEIEYYDFHIPVLDALTLYKKFSKEKQESYSLDNISEVELKKNKLQYDDFSLNQLWNSDSQKYIEYNIWDVELVSLLNRKLNLIDLALTIAYESRVLFKDIFSPVKLWEVIIYNALKIKNIEIPPINRKAEKLPYPGAYVQNPKTGLHKWIISYDINSLYPNIIIGCNLSKETIPHLSLDRAEKIHMSEFLSNDIKDEYSKIESEYTAVDKLLKTDRFIYSDYCKKYDFCYTPNGRFWKRNKQGTVGEIMEKKYNERIAVRKQMESMIKEGKKKEDVKDLDLKQYALKILLNSGYGAFANEYFRYYDIRIASAITLTGQYVIRYIAQHLEKKLSKYIDVIYSDTDSVYISCDKLINLSKDPLTTEQAIKSLEKFSSNIVQKEISIATNEIAEKLNMFKNTLEMKREIIGDVGLWCAMKKYVVRKWMDESEVYTKPKLKFTGIEIVRTSTPKVIREKLKDIVNLILNNNTSELITTIKEYKKEFVKLQPNEIAFPRSISDVEKYIDEILIYKKGTPIHVRGALLYNHAINKLSLGNRYKKIFSGDKIKFLYLKVPNTNNNENIIAFLDKLPPEFQFEKYIDYETQFEKCFVNAVNILTKSFNYDVIKEMNNNMIKMDGLFW